MATMLAPREALENFRRLTQEGAEGEYGFYEAIDYTPERLPKGKRSVVVRSYMAHHQGMSLVALNNALHADVMTHRFQRRADGAGHRPAARGAGPQRRADRRDRSRPTTRRRRARRVAPSGRPGGGGARTRPPSRR